MTPRAHRERINLWVWTVHIFGGSIAGCGLREAIGDTRPQINEAIGIYPMVFVLLGVIFLICCWHSTMPWEVGAIGTITAIALSASIPYLLPHFSAVQWPGGITINFFIAVSIGLIASTAYYLRVVRPALHPPA